jgi:hypothetical protein
MAPLIGAFKLTCIPTDKYKSDFDGESFYDWLEVE